MANKKYYSKCEDCPLNVFIECLVEGNLKSLIISGEPTSEELAIAWAEIYSEYCDLNADNEQMYILTLQKEIILLNHEITEVETVIYFLSPVMLPYSKDKKSELLSIIQKYDYDFKLDESALDYTEQLEVIVNSLAPKKLQLLMKTRELDTYVAEKQNDSIDKNYFKKWLRILATFQKCVIIRPKDITVEDFVLMIKEFYDYHTQKENVEE